MKGVPTGFWGKLEVEGDAVLGWHPLAHHCADVAACAEALLRQTLLRRRLARLAGRDELDPVTMARLCVIAALHDLGKFNQHFQNKGRPGAMPRAGHVRELIPLFDPGRSRHAERFFKALSVIPLSAWGDNEVGWHLLLAAVAHHGRPATLSPPELNDDRTRWETVAGLDPIEGMATLAAACLRWFPEALGEGPKLPSAPMFQHAFAGLVMLADWLGSDRSPERFAFSPDPDDERIAFARERAAVTLRDNAIAIGALAARLEGPITYARFTDIREPRSPQVKMLELPLPQEASLTILEAETGSGKTEAALAHFFRLFQQGAVEGMYFALPTRTAATQLHARVVKAVKQLFQGVAEPPPVVLAVPGYLEVDTLKGTRLADFRFLWRDNDNASAGGQSSRFRTWAAEHPKRYLAASIAVGTIDQCLLAGLVTDHAHLRGTTLLRSLLVVDEVHASDAYMTTILTQVLRYHRAAGGHALLMSATLGAVARDRYLGAAVTPFAKALTEPYPRIALSAPGLTMTPKAPEAGLPKDVAVETWAAIDDPDAIARRAVEAAEAGARVIVLRNTVSACLATQRAVERLAPEALRFQVRGLDTAHHARFVKADREQLDAAIEARLGKHAPVGGCVVVTTQTVQQSLDLDADLMITDLCPVDVLLQRIGRVHRHTRERPEGFAEARCVVLVTDRPLDAMLRADGKLVGRHGMGLVYRDLRVLAATLAEIEKTPRWEIPSMNRHLVESATHPEALKAITPDEPRWREHARKVATLERAEAAIATSNLINYAHGFDRLIFAEFKAPTRLGLNDRRVELPKVCQSPLGSSVSELTIPAWMLRGVDDNTVVTALEQSPKGFTFTFGEATYRYDRLGLRALSDADLDLDAEDDA